MCIFIVTISENTPNFKLKSSRRDENGKKNKKIEKSKDREKQSNEDAHF